MLRARQGRRRVAGGMVLVAMTLPGVAAANLTVVSLDPPARTLTAPVNTTISVTFDRPVDRATITAGSFSAFGRWSGAATGSYRFSDGDTTVTLSPDRPFSAGDSVMVILSHDIAAADATPLRSAGYSYQFWTRAQLAARAFMETDRLTTRTVAAIPTQAYGGIASDLNGDRYPDLTVVHEISADLRVFLNQADRTGRFDPFLQPTFPVGNRASPSEPADFDGDGDVDICVANIDDDTVSILLGNGDGTFGPQQTIAVAAAPRGIAALDVDGDGDVDVVSAGSGAPPLLNLSLMLNDGSGVFGAAIPFPGGTAGAWALGAADMNNDGILDLVVGSRDAQQLVVHTGNGDSTFTQAGTQAAGGRVWMVALGDVDGDGNEDVSTINSFDDSGSILLGSGTGNLATPSVYATDPFGLATDLGDIDGDGDLDWITSSFSGDWRLYLNDGAGSFTFDQAFVPTSASSCALMVDDDNDGDLDLALIDESADEVIVMGNSGLGPGAAPPGVPGSGAGTTPLTVAKLDPAGTGLSVSWDTRACTGSLTGYQILFGGGSDLPASLGGTYTLDGAHCDIGTVSPFLWTPSPDPTSDPTGLVWFLVVANDGTTLEGPWGADGAGVERSGFGPNGSSALCGMTDKDLTNPCGQ